MGYTRVIIRCALPLFLFCAASWAQVIDFESGGLKYKALTRSGVTVIFTVLPTTVREYAVMQVAVSNGAAVSWTVKPDDFSFQTTGQGSGQTVRALPAGTVVGELLQKAGRRDVIRLVAAYEASLFNNAQIHSTNGYESRRQNAFAEFGSSKLKAAAAASAIAMASTKLAPGQSTDGAVFFPHQGKALGAGTLTVKTAGEVFTFPVE